MRSKQVLKNVDADSIPIPTERTNKLQARRVRKKNYETMKRPTSLRKKNEIASGFRSDLSTADLETYVFREWPRNADLRIILDFRFFSTLAVVARLGAAETFASAAEIQVEIEKKGKIRVPLATLYVILDNLVIRGLVSSSLTRTKGRPKAVFTISKLGKDILYDTIGYHRKLAARLPTVHDSRSISFIKGKDRHMSQLV